MSRSFILLLARGLNIGLIPFAPGTFGSLLGFVWAAFLLTAGSPLLFWCGTLAGAALGVWFCGRAEEILQQKDPGSIVLDEIIAYPLCYTGWLFLTVARNSGFPSPGSLWENTWWKHLLIFAAFRFFDVLKPWPVRSSQKLPGGWGVVTDDLLAALYTALISLLWLR